jgi:hypothetical protein
VEYQLEKGFIEFGGGMMSLLGSAVFNLDGSGLRPLPAKGNLHV